MSNSERWDDNRGAGDGDRRQYRAPTCFNCHEQGHYANQCPHRDRRQHSSPPSTSMDSKRSRSPRRFEHRRYVSPPRQDVELRGKLAALSQGVAEMKEHFEAEKAKREAKEQRRLDKERRKEEERRIAEEEEKRRMEEEAKREEKKRKKAEKAKREALLRAEMKKEVTLHATLLMGEIKDDWINQMKSSVILALFAGKQDVKGKKKMEPEPGAVSSSSTDYSDEGSEASMTQEISDKTKQLRISEKRKRVADVALEGSPPMEMPTKRTPRKIARPVLPTDRMTRAKARKKAGCITVRAKKRSPVKPPLNKVLKSGWKATPPSGRITPASKALLRLRYRDAFMRELKDCNADELQRICREEGLHYEGKIHAILDIAEYRSRRQFPEGDRATEVIPLSVSTDTEAVETPADVVE
ncbi:hypothetical protein CBR_g19144 [Chara braunii]|uniref:CCHC-type domain-containing protein n=1 Tax=Chara braunii TaxID=69332 RepID=A0A388KXJ3_CHABU|nr:hypothetical protein CBR_g19144 [Chara braunii]|eukprot:GBG74738.1 hypothetical protein CBR_g19144 [Chara braunii]